MVKNPPEGFTRITPYLFYEDVSAALDWLTTAFGVKERMRLTRDDGSVNHAEVDIYGEPIMMGNPGPDYRRPERAAGLLHVYVDDVDRHYEQAKQAGAKIIQEPTDQFYGDREYGAEDLEGHQWFFATHTRDVPPDELKPQ